MNVLELAPTETDIALANGTPPRLVRYDPTVQEPDFLFEVIDGFIVRKTVGARGIRISSTLQGFLGSFVCVNKLGRTFGQLGYDLPGGGPKRKPDVSFLSESRWPRNREFPPRRFSAHGPGTGRRGHQPARTGSRHVLETRAVLSGRRFGGLAGNSAHRTGLLLRLADRGSHLDPRRRSYRRPRDPRLPHARGALVSDDGCQFVNRPRAKSLDQSTG